MSDLSEKQITALDLVQREPKLQPIFFQQLSGLKWFDALAERNFFDPHLNPQTKNTKDGLIMTPYWPILSYLEKTATELQDPRSSNYSKGYMKVIRSVSVETKTRPSGNSRTWWCFAKLLRHVHIEHIVDDDIELIRYWLANPLGDRLTSKELGKGLLPRLLAIDGDRTLKMAKSLLEALTELSWPQNDGDSVRGKRASMALGGYDASKIFDSQAKTIGSRLGIEGLKIFHERLNEIFSRSNRGRHSTVWRPAIEDHDQNISNEGTEDILLSAYRDALLEYVERHANQATQYVETLLSDSEIIFKRLAIFTVSQHLKPLSSFVPTLLTEPYFDSNFRHEMYQLLERSFTGLPGGEKDRVVSLIERISRRVIDPDQPKPVQARQQSYEALRWLSAVIGKKSDAADAAYESHLSVTGKKPEHPNFSAYFTSGMVGEPTAYTPQELLSMEISELVGSLKTFTPTRRFREPTYYGLALALKAALIAEPEKFRGQLEKLVALKVDYISALVEGYRTLWLEQGYDNWAEVLRFCSTVLRQKRFWKSIDQENSNSVEGNSGWVIAAISDLITAGTTSDKKAFNADLLDLAGSILFTMLDRQKSCGIIDHNDAATRAINNPRGKSIQALIIYSLRRSRLEDADSGSHSDLWEQDLVGYFDREVDLFDRRNYEFFALFGMYILNFLYLDEQWTMNQLHKVFNRDDHLGWLSAINGYSYVDRVNSGIYNFLRSEGHLIAVLDDDEVSRSGKDRIIENIAIGYMRGDEQIGDEAGAIDEIMKSERKEELHHLIWFIWTMRDVEGLDFEGKILPLWGTISDRVDLGDEADQQTLSRLCLWVAFVRQLDSSVAKLVMKASPYSEIDFHSYILVEELRRLVAENPVAVAKVYLEMLTKFAPIDTQDDVEETLVALYEAGGKPRAMANSIVDLYINYRVEFPALIRKRFARV